MKKLHLIAFCLFGCSDLISVFYEIDVSQEQRMDFLLPMKIDQQIQMDQQQDHMINFKREMSIDFLLTDAMLADHDNINRQDFIMRDQASTAIDQASTAIDQASTAIDQASTAIDQGIDLMIIPCGAHCPEIEMIFIEAGSFNMGTDNGTEQPIHEVQIRRNFYVSKTEVTVGQYRTCVDARHCSTPICDVGISNWTDSITSNEMQPMNCINWHEARIFAKWVGGDLLTEAQWEYVAKSKGKSITYPWGDMNPNCQLANYRNCTNRTIDVCTTIGISTQGICDLSGNVWEWVLDEWHDNYINAPINEQAWCNPIGCNSNISTDHVFRGGSYIDDIPALSATFRAHSTSTFHISNLGFRVAKFAH